MQIAKAFGLKVIGTAGTSEGLDLVRNQGADDAYNHRDFEYTEKIKQTYPEGIDIILEMNGQTNLNKDLELLKHRQGRVVVSANLTLDSFFLSDVSVINKSMFNLGYWMSRSC